MKKQYFIALFLLLNTLLFSQSIQRGTDFSSAGHYATTPHLQLQSNVGELMVNTIVNGTMFTQGFVQPEPFVPASIANNGFIAEGTAYPNPVTTNLYIDLTVDTNSDILIEVIDVLGKSQIVPIKNETFIGKNHYQLNFQNFDAGIYFVRITSVKNQLNKTFKITKA